MNKPDDVSLKPCPFCGGGAITCGGNKMNAKRWVMCRSCHACPGGDVPDLADAITAWNTRPLEDAAYAKGQADQRERDTEILEDLNVEGGECMTWEQSLTMAVNGIRSQAIRKIEPARVLKEALFALIKLEATPQTYGGVLIANGKCARITLEHFDQSDTEPPTIATLIAERDELVKALEWYAEQTRLARLIHSGGDSGRHALAADGGQKARATLTRIKSSS